MHSGRFVYSQLLDFLPKHEFDKCVKHSGRRERKAPEPPTKPLHNSTDFQHQPFRENPISQAFSDQESTYEYNQMRNQLNLFDF